MKGLQHIFLLAWGDFAVITGVAAVIYYALYYVVFYKGFFIKIKEDPGAKKEGGEKKKIAAPVVKTLNLEVKQKTEGDKNNIPDAEKPISNVSKSYEALEFTPGEEKTEFSHEIPEPDFKKRDIAPETDLQEFSIHAEVDDVTKAVQ